MRLWLACLSSFLVAPFAAAEQREVRVVAPHDLANVVVRVPLDASPERASALTLADGTVIPAMTSGRSAKDPGLVFVLPKLRANEPLTLKFGGKFDATPAMFSWHTQPGEYVELRHGSRPVLRYMNAAHDASTQDKHDLTFKVFHHVFDPATGQTLLTNGAAPFSDKTQLYPHHRGLFYGFNRISYDGKQADIWHGRKGEYQAHESMLGSEAGPVFGRHRLAIGWYGQDGKKFADEERELTTYAFPGGTLIEFASVLKTDRDEVKLDGDPQHAGFHFRAAQEVAKATKNQTYYLRTDGKCKPGETRNWEPKTKKGPVNLPWNAMSFVVGGKRYTAVYLDHPDNPKEARTSERDYGRFGTYFEYTLTKDKPLKVRYRVWVQEGESTVEACAAMSRAFVSPPKTTRQ